MPADRPHPFRGFLDLFVELERMRHLGRSGGEATDLVIRLDLPGVRPDDISVTFDAGMLTVSGQRRNDLPEATPFYVHERQHGPFHRSMLLPEGVDETMITASFGDGVAEITVAGAARSGEPSRIPVEDRSSRPVTRVGARRPR
jgi:HSP20 family protein